LGVVTTHWKEGKVLEVATTSISRNYNSTLKSKTSYEFVKCTNNQARNEQGAQGENNKTFHEVEVKCTSLACAFLEVRNKTFLQP
jgi:hypothetical protein